MRERIIQFLVDSVLVHRKEEEKLRAEKFFSTINHITTEEELTAHLDQEINKIDIGQVVGDSSYLFDVYWALRESRKDK